VRANPSLLLLVLVWVALLLPSAVRSRIRSSPRTTVGGFRRAMDGLRDGADGTRADAVRSPRDERRGRATAGPMSPSRSGVTGPRREDPAVVRRRTRFVRLVGATVLALAAAPLVGGALAWTVAGLMVAATTTTVVVLRRLMLQRAAARRVVVALDLRRPAPALHDEITGELLLAAGSAANVVRLRSWAR
jgi:hypothetical protein